MMTMIKLKIFALFAVFVLVLGGSVEKAKAVTCSPLQLSSCASAIVSSTPPSALCCSKIKEQRPCLCSYLKNPNLRKFISSPNARKVAKTCGTPFPRC
ncbi:OLC1v1032219C1 [Oldenlandia corymbosa var. corymbosa]|uniref:OLC1v1032219C1 n=1 Tax=Oldenlandia corymbosa var. corymbosa TaxID=529605 RepID=A0AAV1CLY0_OLDCO|nr:OLC1v1032219C1 [Oldenlandia corymbosa var. corymbosa]